MVATVNIIRNTEPLQCWICIICDIHTNTPSVHMFADHCDMMRVPKEYKITKDCMYDILIKCDGSYHKRIMSFSYTIYARVP